MLRYIAKMERIRGKGKIDNEMKPKVGSLTPHENNRICNYTMVRENLPKPIMADVLIHFTRRVEARAFQPRSLESDAGCFLNYEWRGVYSSENFNSHKFQKKMSRSKCYQAGVLDFYQSPVYKELIPFFQPPILSSACSPSLNHSSASVSSLMAALRTQPSLNNPHNPDFTHSSTIFS